MCISVLPSCVHVCHVYAWWPWRSKEGIGSPEIGLKDGCQPTCGSSARATALLSHFSSLHIVFLHVSMRLSRWWLAFELIPLVDHPFQCKGASSEQSRAQMNKRRRRRRQGGKEGGRDLPSHFLIASTGTVYVCPWTWIYIIIPASQASRCEVKDITSFLESPNGSWRITFLLTLCHQLSQFLTPLPPLCVWIVTCAENAQLTKQKVPGPGGFPSTVHQTFQAFIVITHHFCQETKAEKCCSSLCEAFVTVMLKRYKVQKK